MENEKLDLLLEQIKKSAKEQRFMSSRLRSSEKNIRAMNVYYAVFASVTAVLSVLYPQMGFSRLSAMLTVLLSIFVIALSAQKYEQQARHYHVNAYMLEQLLLEAAQGSEYRIIREKYGALAADQDIRNTHENRAVLRMYDIENRRRVRSGEEVLRAHYLCGYEKFKYWLAEITSIVFKVLIFIAPVAALALAAMNLI